MYTLKFVPDSISPNATLNVLKEHFNKKGIYVKIDKNLNLILLKYSRNFCDISDEDVRKCRGLILDHTTYQPICVPPPKSVPLDEFKGKVTDETEIKYEEFLDGTMINLFYRKCENYDGWVISTRSCIGAKCRWYSKRHFCELFDESKHFEYDCFEKDVCYSFVLQHVENRYVKKIETNRVVLIGANRINDFEVTPLKLNVLVEYFMEREILMNVPLTYYFDTIEDAKVAMTQLNEDEQGYVLKWGNMRSKIRNPQWENIKKLKGNTNSLLRNYLELRHDGTLNDFLSFFPEAKKEFDDFSVDLEEIIENLYLNYQKCFVKKQIKHKDMPYIYKPLCYELHSNYLSQHVIVSRDETRAFIDTMPIGRQMFILNNKNKVSNKKDDEDTNQTTENTNETTETLLK